MEDRTLNPFWAQGSAVTDIAMAPEGTAPRLIPYLPHTPGPHTAVIVCPGGAYQRLASHENEPIARWLNTLGIAAFVLEYRVAPHVWPAPLEDAQRAIRLVRCHAATWNVRQDRVGFLGFSAGGHLASAIGTHYDTGDMSATDQVERMPCRPDFLVLCYANIDPVLTRGEGALPANDQWVTPETPPTFLWHTADDARVPVENSLNFATALRHHEVPFELHIYPHGRHGLGLAKDDPVVGTWTALCAQWLANR